MGEVDPTKPNQMIRGVVSLPHGTGKDVKVLVICDADKNSEAKEAGADFYGLDEYLEKIKNGWVDFDVLITSPNFMPKIGPLGRVLGPRSLMPNPKTGTVTDDIGKAVKEGGASAVSLGSMVVYQNKGMGVLVNFPENKKLKKILE